MKITKQGILFLCFSVSLCYTEKTDSRTVYMEEGETMKRIEELIVSHTCRGMEILRPYLPEYFCRDAAEEILHWPKGTVL